MLDHLEQIGHVFQALREKAGLTQQQLADQCGVSRTAVALLEQGRRTPNPEIFESLATAIGVPESLWQHFANQDSRKRHEFEAALGELVGHSVALRMLHSENIRSAENAIDDLFSGDLTLSQAFDSLNSVLVYYGISVVKRVFFDRYFTVGAFQSIDQFDRACRLYQQEAIRLFSTFGEAYRRLNGNENFDELLEPLKTRDIAKYSERTVWEHAGPASDSDMIQKIEEQRLPYLGYISVATYRTQRRKRENLAQYLRELSASVREHGAAAVSDLPESRSRRIDSLMRELDSPLQHTPMSPLFAPNPAELEAEAHRVLRDEADEEEMAATQSQGLRNLSNYMSADYMDVYVATSMRTESDFISVNRFVSSLFFHEAISPLRLRYFNPTQSWIEDRVAKGLVEALMLRRASYTIYMAQKSDTFGKDSEASVALGQGKPVIVYVPRLATSDSLINSESLFDSSASRLREIVANAGALDTEDLDSLDHDGLYTEALAIQLKGLDDVQLENLVSEVWADFGLLDESERIRGERETDRREAYTNFIRGIAERGPQNTSMDSSLRADIIPILRALGTHFEKRAALFRQVHPLALQVILSSGVLNGILVVRSIGQCAQILRKLVENNLSVELQVDAENYRLVETSTKSTIRVISRNNLLVNAFETYYRPA